MLKLKNTINCPGCDSILRVSACVVSDGNEHLYFLCPKCKDLVREDASTGKWVLQEAKSAQIPDLVQKLQGLASEDWRARSSSRESLQPGLTAKK